MYVPEKPVVAAFLARPRQSIDSRTGSEPSLGGSLREKAVWVEEVDCIGCRYCAHVASNTFVMVPETGRCRVFARTAIQWIEYRKRLIPALSIAFIGSILMIWTRAFLFASLVSLATCFD